MFTAGWFVFVGGTVGSDRHTEDEGTWEYGQWEGTHVI